MDDREMETPPDDQNTDMVSALFHSYILMVDQAGTTSPDRCGSVRIRNIQCQDLDQR